MTKPTWALVEADDFQHFGVMAQSVRGLIRVYGEFVLRVRR